MINKVILLGNVGKDVDVKTLESGLKVAITTLATNESYKNKKNGEKHTITEWHNLEFIGNVAEIVEKYVKKGDPIYVEGKIKTTKYNEKYYTKILVNDYNGVIKMLGSKNETQTDMPF